MYIVGILFYVLEKYEKLVNISSNIYAYLCENIYISVYLYILIYIYITHMSMHTHLYKLTTHTFETSIF